MAHTTPPSAPPPPVATAWRRVVAVLVAVAILAVIALSDALYELLLRLIAVGERAIAINPALGATAFVVFAALSAMLAFFSSAVLVPMAIRTWGTPVTILLLWLGWTLGGLCAYSIGRYLGRPVVSSLSSGALLERFEHRITARAPFGLVLLFQLALPSEIPGYVLGILRYRAGKYLLALGLAELPFVLGTVYLGSSFLERRIGLLIAIGAGGALLSGLALHALHKRLPR